MNFNFDLQYFADAGTVVNATTGYVNAGNGQHENFSDSRSLAPEMKTFYDTELLENARAELRYATALWSGASGTPLTALQSSQRA